jgi:hypothetical protein
VSIKRVRFGQFMFCQGCGTLFLVAEGVGAAQVWHASCGVALDLQLSVLPFEEATLGVVTYVRDRSRLEVTPGFTVT